MEQGRNKGWHMTGPSEPQSDLLYGVPAIAAHLGVSARQARHLGETGAIPTFKLPGNKIICARRSTLNAWLAEREALSRNVNR